MSVQELREKRTAKAREYRNILDKNPGVLTTEETTKLDALAKDIDDLEATIARHEQAMELESERQVQDAATQLAKDKPGNTLAKVFDKWVRGGDNALSAEDWNTVRATMSTGTGSEGGYTVPTETAKTLIDALKKFGGMRQAATVISTSAGHEMQWPTSDGTSEEGEIVGENEEATAADPTFGTKSLVVYKFSSKVVAIPIELLQDSSIDLESFIRLRLAQRLGRITNKKFTIGTGSGEPTGIVTAVGVGKTGASGLDDSVDYDSLVDLIHSVDPAYREMGNCRFMFHDLTLRDIKKLKDEQGRPLYLPSIDVKDPATINGYGYTINQQIAQMAANAKSILFGDFSHYIIRDAMQILYYRFTDSAYAKKGQVGFLCFLRSGGNFMDVGGAVKAFKNAAS
ncbi:MAG: capsid protein [Desulfovibrionaceae bacterium CG1_02_65_16]|nr:MAG: capsid protein [Desulfovibrionaceae bacterium CG1_02_65_16]